MSSAESVSSGIIASPPGEQEEKYLVATQQVHCDHSSPTFFRSGSSSYGQPARQPAGPPTALEGAASSSTFALGLNHARRGGQHLLVLLELASPWGSELPRTRPPQDGFGAECRDSGGYSFGDFLHDHRRQKDGSHSSHGRGAAEEGDGGG